MQSLIHSHSALHLIHAGLITSKFSLRHKKTALACAYIPERCAVCIAAGYGICARMRLSATTASDPERAPVVHGGMHSNSRTYCTVRPLPPPGSTYTSCIRVHRSCTDASVRQHAAEYDTHAVMHLSVTIRENTHRIHIEKLHAGG